MRQVIVGVADCRVSDDPETVLITYALGSCIALAVYDPAARVGGLLHFMLPDSTLDPQKAARNPYMFADTGIPLLFREVYRHGGRKGRIVVRAAGGAAVMDDCGVFNIGKRNWEAARKILRKAGVRVGGKAIGGTGSRSVRLDVATGDMWCWSAAEPELELPLRGRKVQPWRRL